MKGSNLGELEELILLTVGILYRKAYGVAVMDEIEKQTGRSLNISAVHAVLQRLEDKGFVRSELSEPTGERGGRRKRMFHLTAAGKKALEEVNELRNQMFNQIPKIAFQASLVPKFLNDQLCEENPGGQLNPPIALNVTPLPENKVELFASEKLLK
jgi:DNA-binding PadR family transcriptional regulator